MNTSTKMKKPKLLTRIDKIIIRNFKSIRGLELNVKPGVNVLVGPNGAGKSNILEAIYFLRKTLVEEAGRTPYLPHQPDYWKPEDLIYGMDPEKEIILGLGFTSYDEKYKLYIEYLIHYRIINNTIMPVKHTIKYNSDETIIEISPEKIIVKIHKDLIEDLLTSNISRILKRKSISLFNIEKALQRAKYVISSLYHEKGRYRVFEYDLKEIPPYITRYSYPFISIEGTPSACIVIYRENNRSYIDDYLGLIKYSKKFPIYIVRKHLRSNHVELSLIARSSIDILADIGKLNYYVRQIIDKIIFLKHPDLGALREPRPVSGSRLDPRGVNLASVLLYLMGKYGAFPEGINDGLQRFFPNLRISVKFEFGRAVITGVEDGFEFPPSNLPDGTIKLLTILTAIELEPTMLLIDEIENSMHAKMLEYIVDRLNDVRNPVLVATHSPIVVDLVEPDRIFIVEKDLEKGTIARKIRDPETLSKKLVEDGIALSDYIFYKETYGD